MGEAEFSVALRKESVDRNFGMERKMQAAVVALRKESVDRNRSLQPQELVCRNVALRKESVDRNVDAIKRVLHQLVALRKESVDRNLPLGPTPQAGRTSLSARRAWIEIADIQSAFASACSRSPQGERG